VLGVAGWWFWKGWAARSYALAKRFFGTWRERGEQREQRERGVEALGELLPSVVGVIDARPHTLHAD